MNFRHRQTNRGTVSAADIIAAYQQAFNISWWRMLLSTVATILGIGGIFRLADASYREIDDAGEQRFFMLLEKDKTDLEQYVVGDFDCDDFTFRLYGEIHKDLEFAAMPIYITWVSWDTPDGRTGHAAISYYKDGVVKIVEPQNDDIYSVPIHWRLDMLCG